MPGAGVVHLIKVRANIEATVDVGERGMDHGSA
jgi:hypothetical protein